jgi:hypothetical protein
MLEALRQHQPQHTPLPRRRALGGGVGAGGGGGGGGGRGALPVVHHDLDADRVWLQPQPHRTLRLCLPPATGGVGVGRGEMGCRGLLQGGAGGCRGLQGGAGGCRGR